MLLDGADCVSKAVLGTAYLDISSPHPRIAANADVRGQQIAAHDTPMYRCGGPTLWR